MHPSDFTNISFPLFGIDINPPRTFSIGPFTVHFYGLIIAVGLLLAVIYGCKRAKLFGIKEDDLLDGVLFVTPFAILCARLYYCAFEWEHYSGDLIKILRIWDGGLAIYGGVLGAIVGVLVLCKVKKIKVGAVLDVVAIGFLIGQAMGRWGNFFNREAFGAVTDSFLRMGLLNGETGEVVYVHPTFLYESLWNVAGFLLLHFLSKKRRYDGQIALGYAAWYGLGRFFIEGLRVDSLYWGPFRVSQVLAAVSCVAALAVLLLNMMRSHDKAKMQVNIAAAREAAKQQEEEAKEKAESAEEAEAEPESEATEEAEAETETEEAESEE